MKPPWHRGGKGRTTVRLDDDLVERIQTQRQFGSLDSWVIAAVHLRLAATEPGEHPGEVTPVIRDLVRTSRRGWNLPQPILSMLDTAYDEVSRARRREKEWEAERGKLIARVRELEKERIHE